MPKPPNRKFRIYNEDCFKTFKRLKDQSIDMVMVDPPYGTTACKWDSIIPLEPMWKELKRVIKPNGALVFTASQPFTTTLISSNMKMFKYCWVWEKNRCGNFMTAKFQPLKYTEDIIVFGFGAINTKGGRGGGKTDRPFLNYNPQGYTKNEVIIKRDKPLPTDGVNRWNKLSNKKFESKGKNYPKNIIRFNSTERKNRLHPTQKPVALMEYLIKTYTNEGETVLDFAMGSGTTGVACVNLGRKFIGCDNDTEHGYFEIAKERIEDAKTDIK